jgi:hypothetical protein
MSAIPASLHAIFADLGPTTPCVEGVSFLEEDRAWAVSLDDDDAALLVEWEEDPARLALTAPLGRPAPDQQAQVYEALLAFNLFRRDTNGTGTGLLSDSGELLLMREAPADAMTLDQLREIVLDFAAIARAWRRHVANPIAHEPAFPASLDLQALRV